MLWLKKRKIIFALALIFLFPLVSNASEDLGEEEKTDPFRASLFIQSGVGFIGFDDRDKFETATDSIYAEFRAEARTKEDTLAVSRQNFQKVNIAFPLYAGVQFQPFKNHFLSAAVGFIYDNESIVLTDRNGKAHNYNYTLQGIPFFIEYRFAIPNAFLSLSGESLFSLSARWYWMLPGTEIYSTWGYLSAKNSPLGNGFGISLGYLIGSWKQVRIYGDLGFNSISVQSDKSFTQIVPIYEKESEDKKPESARKARWDLGGIQLQIRVSFGAWERKPSLQELLPENSSSKNQTPDDLNREAPDDLKKEISNASFSSDEIQNPPSENASIQESDARETPAQESPIQESPADLNDFNPSSPQDEKNISQQKSPPQTIQNQPEKIPDDTSASETKQ